MDAFFIKFRKRENIPFLIFAICMVIIHSKIHLIAGSDDDFMSTSIKNGNLTQLYANNRIVLNFLGSFIMSFPLIIWKIFNIAILLFFIIGISKCTIIISKDSVKNNNVILNWGVCFLFFLLPFNILSSGIFWATGAFNYFWGLCGSLFICLVFIKDMFEIEVKKEELIAGLILGIYACDVEQPMVIICIGGIIYLAYCFFNHKKIRKNMFMYGIVLILECMPIVFLPFSSYRSIGEQTAYFPNFGMLTFLDKIYQGTMHYYNHLVNELSLVFFLIALFTVILVFRNIQSIIFHIIATLPLLYFLYALVAPITIVKLITTLDIDCYIYDFSVKLYYWGIGKDSFLPFFFATFNLILLIILLLYVLQTNYQRYAILFFCLAAFATGIMMSFAPSIFVSGHRVFFASDILFFIVAAILGRITIMSINIPKSGERIFSCVALCTMLVFSVLMGTLQNKGISY